MCCLLPRKHTRPAILFIRLGRFKWAIPTKMQSPIQLCSYRMDLWSDWLPSQLPLSILPFRAHCVPWRILHCHWSRLGRSQASANNDTLLYLDTRPPLNIKAIIPVILIPIIKLRQFHDSITYIYDGNFYIGRVTALSQSFAEIDSQSSDWSTKSTKTGSAEIEQHQIWIHFIHCSICKIQYYLKSNVICVI